MTDLSVSSPAFSLAPKSLDEALKFADVLAKSSIVPKDFNGNPGNILVAIQWGMELGLQPMQAMQNIAVINGRPSLWGDAVIALVRGSPLCESIIETIEGDVATCRVKRRGEPEQSRSFSMADAKAANLTGKQGPWSQYPKRMLQMRARAFALRDVFPDVLRGMPVAEEVMDMPGERDITQPAPAIAKEPQKPAYTDDQMQAAWDQWTSLVESGKATAEKIIANIGSKYVLSAQQIEAIRTLDPIEGEQA